MNPYASPGASSTGATEEDIAAAAPPVLAKVAGGVVALAGAVVGLTGLQTLMIVDLRGALLSSVPYVLAILGATHIVLGAAVFRARVWAALCALGGTVLLALLSAAWLVFSIGHGLLSLYALGAPMVSVAALVFAILALGPCQRASAARARLRDQGMNLGI